MKTATLGAFTAIALFSNVAAHAVPVFSTPECVVKGIVQNSQQRIEEVHDKKKVFNDATLFVLEQDFSNDNERSAAHFEKMNKSCSITDKNMVYQLRDDFVTFKDDSLEKTLEGQCVQGHSKLSDIDNTLGIWLYDIEVLSPEECMVTASE